MNEKLDLGLNASLTAQRQGIRLADTMLAGIEEDQVGQETGNEKIERFSDVEESNADGSNRWEVVVKYHGPIETRFGEFSQILWEPLLFGYGIVTLLEEEIEQFSMLDQVEYMEKPRAFFSQIQEQLLQTTCIKELQTTPYSLTGKGVLLAILDSGIDAGLDVFKTSSGSRIVAYLDLSKEENAGELIIVQPEDIPQITDQSGHGTAVASIAAGTDFGIAQEAELLIVKLGRQEPYTFSKTTDIMRGVTQALFYAQERNQPLVINLSYGTNYGSHQGNSLLERFLENASEVGRCVICVGSGNEADQNGHFQGVLKEREQYEVEIAMGRFEKQIVLELFFGYLEVEKCVLQTPDGKNVNVSLEEGTKEEDEDVEIYGYFMAPTPFLGNQEAYMQIVAKQSFIPAGIWKILIRAKNIKDGIFQVYMTSGSAKNADTLFLRPTPEGTFTIPSTAQKVLSVGACNLDGTQISYYSGRGFLKIQTGIYQNKPDLIAPGDQIQAILPGGEVSRVTGTSFATPVVSGACALLMEWGIVKGNDPALYGQKCKARLCQAAVPIRGSKTVPDNLQGWGVLCAGEAIKR